MCTVFAVFNLERHSLSGYPGLRRAAAGVTARANAFSSASNSLGAPFWRLHAAGPEGAAADLPLAVLERLQWKGREG